MHHLYRSAHLFSGVLITVALFLFPLNLQAQESSPPRFHVAFEALGSTTGGFGLNLGFSPSPAFDLGLGTIIFPFGFSRPEIHSYFRWNLLENPITPFLQVSVSYFDQMSGEGQYSPWFFRAHAGVKWQTSLPLFLGANVSYEFLAPSYSPSPILLGILNPAFFVGWNF